MLPVQLMLSAKVPQTLPLVMMSFGHRPYTLPALPRLNGWWMARMRVSASVFSLLAEAGNRHRILGRSH